MSSTTTTDPKGGGSSTIQLDTMSLDQLNTLKQREESRLQALSQRYSALRQAAARINAAKHAVQELYNCDTPEENKANDATNISTSDDTTGGICEVKDDHNKPIPTTKDVFVPLTESVYVPGKIRIRNNSAPSQPLSDKDEPLLLIELGTGYFVEQNTTATKDYLQRKLNLVDANSDNGTFLHTFMIVQN